VTGGWASASATGRTLALAAGVSTTGWWNGSGGTATAAGWASPFRPPNGSAVAA